MKHKTALSLIFFLCMACISQRKHQKISQESIHHKTNEQIVNDSKLYQQQQQDSNHVEWQFWTQSPFRYHSDSGLYAQQGTLRLMTKSASDQKTYHEYQTSLYQSQDSLLMITNQKEQLNKQTQSRYIRTIAGILGLTGIIMLYKARFRIRP